jgi:hypothetical protein
MPMGYHAGKIDVVKNVQLFNPSSQLRHHPSLVNTSYHITPHIHPFERHRHLWNFLFSVFCFVLFSLFFFCLPVTAASPRSLSFMGALLFPSRLSQSFSSFFFFCSRQKEKTREIKRKRKKRNNHFSGAETRMSATKKERGKKRGI